MNQRVHWCISGCLTLKFSGSWKTVRMSLLSVALADDWSLVSLDELSEGEMGMVSSGTCWLGFGAVATSAMVTCGEVGGWGAGARIFCRAAVEDGRGWARDEVSPKWKGGGEARWVGCLLNSRRARFSSDGRAGAVVSVRSVRKVKAKVKRVRKRQRASVGG